jgi:hypothetical protein
MVIEGSTEEGATISQISDATEIVTAESMGEGLADHSDRLNESSFDEELEDETEVNKEVNEDRFQM